MSNRTPAPDELPQLLLVEDSETSATLLHRYLNGRYQVRHARDGQEAWDILASDPQIDLVVTDIQMPNMSGHELLRKIRSSEHRWLHSLPVIVMTTADDKSERDKAFANGANDFIVKPVDAIELQARVGVHHKLARTIRQLEASQQRLQEQATTDPLTLLKNRRAFTETGTRHFALARRHGQDLSLVVIDIDHFKKVNDTFGHMAGDDALVGLANVLVANSRTEDTPARIGGEEFAILLPNINRLGAALFAERLRETIEKTPFLVGGQAMSLTVSGGVSSYGADGGESLDDLILVADKRLYIAKQNGRNRIVVRDLPNESTA
ncbi:MAG: diguanylate cyclase [Gammaproteobacteria bacterium]|nr:diguanylate cyclase [Gammaproteobacteria bacterium]